MKNLSLSRRMRNYKLCFNAVVIVFPKFNPNLFEGYTQILESWKNLPYFQDFSSFEAVITPSYINIYLGGQISPRIMEASWFFGQLLEDSKISFSTFDFYRIPKKEIIPFFIRGQNYNVRLYKDSSFYTEEPLPKSFIQGLYLGRGIPLQVANFRKN
jgi:hypothetical protein